MILSDLIRHSFTLQVEIIAMVSEEIQQRAESYVQKHSDESYERYLNQIINNLEKTVDVVSAPIEQWIDYSKKLQGNNQNPLGLNWSDALDTLNARIQELKRNLKAQ